MQNKVNSTGYRLAYTENEIGTRYRVLVPRKNGEMKVKTITPSAYRSLLAIDSLEDETILKYVNKYGLLDVWSKDYPDRRSAMYDEGLKTYNTIDAIKKEISSLLFAHRLWWEFTKVMLHNSKSDLYLMFAPDEQGRLFLTNQYIPSLQFINPYKRMCGIQQEYETLSTTDKQVELLKISLNHIMFILRDKCSNCMKVHYGYKRGKFTRDELYYTLMDWIWQQFANEVCTNQQRDYPICKWCHEPIYDAKHSDCEYHRGKCAKAAWRSTKSINN